jgi:hypothetical protein
VDNLILTAADQTDREEPVSATEVNQHEDEPPAAKIQSGDTLTWSQLCSGFREYKERAATARALAKSVGSKFS